MSVNLDDLVIETVQPADTSFGTFGTCGYGDWDQVLDSFAERTADRRWSSELLHARCGSRTEGMVVVHRSRVPELPDANLRQALIELDPDPGIGADARDLLFVGGHSGLVGGMAIRGRADPIPAESTIAALAAHALQLASDRRMSPVALYVPHAQVPAFIQVWTPAARLYPAGVQSSIRLNGVTTLEGFLAQCDKDARNTWRRDLRELDERGIQAQRCDVSTELMRASAPLVAAVKVRNGTFDAAPLTRFRLCRWADASGRRRLAWTVRGPGEELVGVSMGELRGQALVLTDIGIVPDHPDRSAFYRELAFRAPTQFALDEGLEAVHLGSGHALPKRARGAVQTAQWHLVGSAVHPARAVS
jgi:hypothetical protein